MFHAGDWLSKCMLQRVQQNLTYSILGVSGNRVRSSDPRFTKKNQMGSGPLHIDSNILAFPDFLTSSNNSITLQLLAVAAPTVFFHFYSMYVNSQVEKIKKAEERQREIEEGDEDVSVCLRFNLNHLLIIV